MRLLKTLGVTTLLLSPLPAAAQELVVDVPAIANKSADQVAAVLGQPSATEQTRHAGRTLPKLLYQDGNIEIVFVDSKADWITVYRRLPLRKQSLRFLNLPVRNPTFHRSGFVMRWQNGAVPGIKELSLFPDYVYINVRTLP